MNIILIGGQCIPGIGGVESYTFNMAKALLALGQNVTIISSGRLEDRFICDCVEIINKLCPRTNIVALPLLFFKSISYILKNRKFIDVINYQSIFLAFIPGWIAKICGCKVCYTIHSLAEDNPKHGWLMRFLIKIVAFISIWCCGNKILTISQSKAQEIYSRYWKKCYVIPCGVNPPLLDSNSDILSRFNIRQGTYFLTIGRIDPIKNLDTLINAFLRSDCHNYQLVIAGDYTNSYGDYLMKLSQNDNRVIFVGSVMGADKECLLKHCMINCLVSSSEGMPISLLEAMIYGKASIVSDIPAIREVLQNDLGYWCKVNDVASLTEQMNIVVNNYNKVIKDGAMLATYVSKYHIWNKVAKKYENYILSI